MAPAKTPFLRVSSFCSKHYSYIVNFTKSLLKLSRSVVENHLALDVNVLCQILEYICALFVLSHRLRRYGTIHDITLTRRWMLSFFNDSTPREQDVKLLGLFLRPMRSLMNEVYFGKAGKQLCYDGYDQQYSLKRAFLLYNRGRRIDNQIRNMMAARM